MPRLAPPEQWPDLDARNMINHALDQIGLLPKDLPEHEWHALYKACLTITERIYTKEGWYNHSNIMRDS